MLAERVVEWTQEWKREGLQEGRQQGQANLLKLLLIQRFGELPGWAQARLSSATTKELEQWGKRLLEASTLEEIFGLS